LVVVVRRTPWRGSIKKPKGNALGGHAPHTAAPRMGKIIVINRRVRVFGSVGCCGAANALEGQHKKAKGQRPWWTRPTHQRPEVAKSL